MRPHLPQSQIRPKITTMPRQKTEAAAYLDIYKLVTEKTRLQQELVTLEQRRDLIQQRLETLEGQIADLEVTAHQRRDAELTPTQPSIKAAAKAPAAESSSSFNTMFLEY
ncbi:hypothetical protein [Pantanalinema sp. GBBB05]|uniref:hypothetical protein n=1 Tax=Pantanalinema sp. GBBB05 TaxID=2604139 RepID=UPI001D7555A7|nr:hypothetical protein [Pantanalinema sp. GBBB05]